MKLLLYCTKSKWQLFKDIITGKWLIDKIKNGNAVNGKIVAECDYEVEEIEELSWQSDANCWYPLELLKKSCLNFFELSNYLDGNKGYAIHIKNLNIFDVPKDLSEYSKNVEHCKCDECLENCKKYCKYYYAKNNITQTINTGCITYALLYKAPQNMCKVFYRDDDMKILISIHPEWLCKILNGEKTIEVRKKVLKEMLK